MSVAWLNRGLFLQGEHICSVHSLLLRNGEESERGGQGCTPSAHISYLSARVSPGRQAGVCALQGGTVAEGKVQPAPTPSAWPSQSVCGLMKISPLKTHDLWLES